MEEFLTDHGLVLFKFTTFCKTTLENMGSLLPWKRNLEAGLMWKITWLGHCHVLTI